MPHTGTTRRIPIIMALVLLFALVFSSLMPWNRSSAASLPSRRVELADNRIYNVGPPVRGDVVTYTAMFNIGATANIGSMEFNFCTTPLGACTAWSGTAISATLGTNTINGAAASFTLGTAGDAPTASRLRITRTAASATAGQAAVITFSALRNPNATCNGSVNACTFYVRIQTYQTATYTTAQDDGVVAVSVQNQTTVSFRVQEILDFCVGTLRNTAGGTGGGSIITPANFSTTNFTSNNLADCDGTGIGSPSIDLGIAQSTTVRSSPVATTAGIEGSDNYGLAMVFTNAANGTVIGYRAIQDTSSGFLKVAGATCSGTSTSDQCINSVGTPAADTFPAATAGTSAAISATGTTEAFGMTVPAVNTVSRSTTVLTRAGDYVGNGNGTGGTCTANAGDCWLWSPSATDFIATAAGAVDFEALMLDFAAKAALTTPPGSYVANVDYYAVGRY